MAQNEFTAVPPAVPNGRDTDSSRPRTSVSLLSSGYPGTVVQLADQPYPGIVIDGSSLFVLEAAAGALKRCLEGSWDATAAPGLADAIAHELSRLFMHYTDILARKGITSPAQAALALARPAL